MTTNITTKSTNGNIASNAEGVFFESVMYSYCVLCYILMQSYVLLNIIAKLCTLYNTYTIVLLTLRDKEQLSSKTIDP